MSGRFFTNSRTFVGRDSDSLVSAEEIPCRGVRVAGGVKQRVKDLDRRVKVLEGDFVKQKEERQWK